MSEPRTPYGPETAAVGQVVRQHCPGDYGCGEETEQEIIFKGPGDSANIPVSRLLA